MPRFEAVEGSGGRRGGVGDLESNREVVRVESGEKKDIALRKVGR